jgi:hypothetical protein
MSLALPPLVAIIFAVVGHVAGTIVASTFGIGVAPKAGAVLGGAIGLGIWLASDAPVATGPMTM